MNWDACDELDETWWFFLRVAFGVFQTCCNGIVRLQDPAACVNCKMILPASLRICLFSDHRRLVFLMVRRTYWVWDLPGLASSVSMFNSIVRNFSCCCNNDPG